MKPLKNYAYLFYIITPVLAVLSLVWYFIAPNAFTHIVMVNWVSALFGLIIICSPWGSIQLTTKKNDLNKLAWPYWLGKIFLLEIALFALFYAVTQFINIDLPIETTRHPQAFADALQTSILTAGLFPWATIAILAASFGFTAVINNKDSYLSTNINLNYFRHNKPTIEAAINGIARVFTMSALGLAAVLVCLIFASIVSKPDSLMSIFGLNSSAMGVVLLMLFITYRRKSNRLWQTVQKQRPALGILLMTCIWGLMLALISLVLLHSVGMKQSSSLSLFNFIFNSGWISHWQVFATTWWICFIPLTSIFIAKFSQGYSLRALILATLILPFVLAVFLLLKHYFAWTFYFETPLWLIQGIAIASFAVLLSLIANAKVLPLLMQSYLAKPGPIKHRNEEFFMQRWKKACGVVFYFFIPAGVFVLSLFMMLAYIPFVMILLAVSASFIIALKKYKYAG